MKFYNRIFALLLVTVYLMTNTTFSMNNISSSWLRSGISCVNSFNRALDQKIQPVVSYLANSSPWVRFCNFLAYGSHEVMTAIPEGESWDQSPLKMPTDQFHRLDDDQRSGLLFLTSMQLMSCAINTYQHCSYFSQKSAKNQDSMGFPKDSSSDYQSSTRSKTMPHHDVHFNITKDVSLGCTLNNDLTLTCCVNNCKSCPFMCTNIDLLSRFDPLHDCCTTTKYGTVICGKSFCNQAGSIPGVCTDSGKGADDTFSFSQMHTALIAELSKGSSAGYLKRAHAYVKNIEDNLNTDLKKQAQSVLKTDYNFADLIGHHDNRVTISDKIVLLSKLYALDVMLARERVHHMLVEKDSQDNQSLYEDIQSMYQTSKQYFENSTNFDFSGIDTDQLSEKLLQSLKHVAEYSLKLTKNCAYHIGKKASSAVHKLVLQGLKHTAETTKKMYCSFMQSKMISPEMIQEFIIAMVNQSMITASIAYEYMMQSDFTVPRELLINLTLVSANQTIMLAHVMYAYYNQSNFELPEEIKDLARICLQQSYLAIKSYMETETVLPQLVGQAILGSVNQALHAADLLLQGYMAHSSDINYVVSTVMWWKINSELNKIKLMLEISKYLFHYAIQYRYEISRGANFVLTTMDHVLWTSFTNYCHYRSIVTSYIDVIVYKTLEQTMHLTYFILKSGVGLGGMYALVLGAMIKDLLSSIIVLKDLNFTLPQCDAPECRSSSHEVINPFSQTEFVADQSIELVKKIEQADSVPTMSTEIVKKETSAADQQEGFNVPKSHLKTLLRLIKRQYLNENDHKKNLGADITADIIGALASYDTNPQSSRHLALSLLNDDKIQEIVDPGIFSQGQSHQKATTMQELCSQSLPAVNVETLQSLSDEIMFNELKDTHLRATILFKLDLMVKALAEHIKNIQEKKSGTAKD